MNSDQLQQLQQLFTDQKTLSDLANREGTQYVILNPTLPVDTIPADVMANLNSIVDNANTQAQNALASEAIKRGNDLSAISVKGLPEQEKQ